MGTKVVLFKASGESESPQRHEEATWSYVFSKRTAKIRSQSRWNRGSLCTRPRTLCPKTSAYFYFERNG